MKNKELIEYLQGFDPESEVYIGAVNVTERKKYHTEMAALTDGSRAAIFLNVIGEVGFDEVERQAVEEIENEAERESESETE